MTTLTVREAADRLTAALGRPVTAHQVRRWARLGDLSTRPAPGRKMLIEERSVAAWERRAKGES